MSEAANTGTHGSSTAGVIDNADNISPTSTSYNEATSTPILDNLIDQPPTG